MKRWGIQENGKCEFGEKENGHANHSFTCPLQPIKCRYEDFKEI